MHGCMCVCVCVCADSLAWICDGKVGEKRADGIRCHIKVGSKRADGTRTPGSWREDSDVY